MKFPPPKELYQKVERIGNLDNRFPEGQQVVGRRIKIHNLTH